jgi:hypothetical protein
MTIVGKVSTHTIQGPSAGIFPVKTRKEERVGKPTLGMIVAVQAGHLHRSGIAHVSLESRAGHGCPMAIVRSFIDSV